MTDPVATALEEIRERAKGPMRKFRDVDASQRDVPHLLAALEAVLKLADDWEEGSFRLDVGAAVMDGCARELREAIAAALTRPGADRG